MNTKVISSVRPKLKWKSRLFLNLISKIKVGEVEIVINGHTFNYKGEMNGPFVKLIIKNEKAISRIISASDIGLAEAIEHDWIECSDYRQLILLACYNERELVEMMQGTFLGTLAFKIKHLFRRNTRKNSKKNIHAHYDLGNAFYTEWLDETMTYSSGIFNSESESLTQSQINKYERILQQINPKAGDHLLEIGCGWGGFALYAIQTRKVKLHCVTLSQEQYDYVQKLIDKHNLSDSWKVEIRDYRDLTEKYDHVVSIEMIEAVGKEYWSQYFDIVARSLKQGGVAVIQAITIQDKYFESYSRGTDFIQQYIFPGGMLLSNNNLRSLASHVQLEVLDLFEFGKDYARTLNEWDKNFMKKIDIVKKIGFDDRFIRLWRFYFHYCEAGFLSERINVCQITVRK